MGMRGYNTFVKVLLLLVTGLQMFVRIGCLAMLPILEAGETKWLHHQNMMQQTVE